MADRQPHSQDPSPSPTSSSSNTAPSRSSLESSRSPPSRNPSLRLSSMPSSASQHRQSFSESLRGLPPSPRSQRQPSLSQQAVQDLIDNPPAQKSADTSFSGRDWRSISIAELVTPEDLKFVELDTGVEAATNLLIDSGAPVLLIRENSTSKSAIGTFDYADLNAYLLLAVGLSQPDEEHITSFLELAKKAREGSKIPLKDVKDLGRKEPITTLPHTAGLMNAIEAFGSGAHRVLVVKEGTSKVTGIVSQSKLVKFLWENSQAFPVIDQLYPLQLRDLRLGLQKEIISVNGDQPLSTALELLNNESVTSLPVLDNAQNVIGNISVADVKLLTKSSSLPLLRNTCIHFISVILSTRGMNEGKDSFPVFHVTPVSTLAHTVAKLVATKSHRMWMTEPASPSSSGPPTPSSHPASLAHTISHSSSISASSAVAPPPASPRITNTTPNPTTIIPPPHSSTPPPPSAGTFIAATGPTISASALPGARLSGLLAGVVSLTDILNLFARASGLHPTDPTEAREQRRRRSSSSSLGVRKSGEVGRTMSIGSGAGG